MTGHDEDDGNDDDEFVRWGVKVERVGVGLFVWIVVVSASSLRAWELDSRSWIWELNHKGSCNMNIANEYHTTYE